MKKTLLIATDNFLPRWDGIARFLSEILPSLSKEYQITVLAPNFSHSHLDYPNYSVVRFPLLGPSVGDFPPAWPKRKVVEWHIHRADLVWVQTIGPIGSMAIYYAREHKKKILAYTHSIEWELVARSISRFPKTIEKAVRSYARVMYNLCDVLMVPSAEIGEIFRKNNIHTKQVIVPMGINTEKFFPPSSKADAKVRLGLPKDANVVGFVGRIGREKNLSTLFSAFEMLSIKNKFLLIVGKGVENEIKRFHGRKDIMLFGQQNDVVPYLQAMDIYVLPSLTETTSLSTLEAMSTGLVVIATGVGSVTEYLLDKQNGILFPKENPLVLKKKIEAVFTDSDLMHELGAAARQTVTSRYSWTKTVLKIEQVLDEY